MVRVLQPFSVVLATALSLGLVAADTSVSVLGDATYSIPDFRGVICIGSGATPTGTACPLKGEVASDNCREGIPSYKDSQCIAPQDTECVIVTGETWGCAYPSGYATEETPYQSYGEVVETPYPSTASSTSSYGEVANETPYQQTASSTSASGYGDAEVTYPVQDEEVYPKEDEVTFPYESETGPTPYPSEVDDGKADEVTPCPTLPYNTGGEESTTEETPCPTLPYNTGGEESTTEETPCPTLPYNTGGEDSTTEETPCPTLPYSYSTGGKDSTTEETPCPTLPYSYSTGGKDSTTEDTPCPTLPYNTGGEDSTTEETPCPKLPYSYNTGGEDPTTEVTPCPTYNQGGENQGDYPKGGDSYSQKGGDYHEGGKQNYDGSVDDTQDSDSTDTPCSSSKDNGGSYGHQGSDKYDGSDSVDSPCSSSKDYDGSHDEGSYHGGEYDNKGSDADSESYEGSQDGVYEGSTASGSVDTPCSSDASSNDHYQDSHYGHSYEGEAGSTGDKYPSKYLRGSSYGDLDDDIKYPTSGDKNSYGGEDSETGYPTHQGSYSSASGSVTSSSEDDCDKDQSVGGNQEETESPYQQYTEAPTTASYTNAPTTAAPAYTNAPMTAAPAYTEAPTTPAYTEAPTTAPPAITTAPVDNGADLMSIVAEAPTSAQELPF